MAYELKNDMSETIGGGWKETFHIPARSQMYAVVKIPLGEDPSVRRQGFLDRLQLRLSEYLAHLFVDVKRPACGIASAVR